MTNQKNATDSGPPDDLRARAEKSARGKASAPHEHRPPLAAEEAWRLVHELQIHQIELEMQNEELNRARAELEVSSAKYFDLYDLAPVGYFTVSDQGVILEANLAAAELLGMVRSALFGRKFSVFISPADRGTWVAQRTQLDEKETQHSWDMRMQRADGTLFWAHLEAALAQNGGSRITINDISERKQTEELIQDILESVDQEFLVVDRDFRIRYANRAYATEVGTSLGEILGRPCYEISPRKDKTCHEFGAACPAKQVFDTGASSGPVHHTQSDAQGNPLVKEVKAFPLSRNSRGEVQTAIESIVDVTDRISKELEINHLAFSDPLTKLPNRRLLCDRLEQAIIAGARSGQHGALLILDLDHFKDLNDSRGHDVGDLLLTEVGRRLQAATREGDTVSRQGGDEFSVLLPHFTAREQEAVVQAGYVSEKIRASLALPYDLNGFEHHGSASVGVCLFHGHETTADEVLKHADVAMYLAKKDGGNCVRFFDRNMQERIAISVALVDDLSKAIQGRQLELHYQPQVDNERRVIGAEALLRWTHPRYGAVSPREFIALAEETGSILPIGSWVLQSACEQLKAWSGARSNLRLAVNVSGRQFRQPVFADELLRILKQTGADPGRLIIELTERPALDDMAGTMTRMHVLKGVGIGFSMDDFGTGYSSLSCIRDLPLDQIKIDESCVHELTIDPDGDAMVRTIIAMGRTQGLEVVAEGVETHEQLAFLSRHNCQAYQGHLFGSSMPPEEFGRALVEGGIGDRA